MKFAGSMKSLMLLLVAAALSACGGGGGSGNDSGFNPPGVNLSASTSNVAINTRSAATITIRMTQANGAPVADGTRITGVVNSSGLGNLAAIGSGSNGISSQGTTAGGAVTFIFQSGGSAGTGSVTFSGQDPSTPARTVSTTVNVAVSAGPGTDPRISFQPEKTQININPQNVPFFVGSPYVSEVLINVRSASGQPLNDTNSGPQTVQLSIDPAELGSVSPQDDPSTPDIDERSQRFAAVFSGPVVGTVRAFVWSKDRPGIVNLRASFTDPDTGQRVEGVQQIQIVSAVPPGAASVTISPPQNPIYVRNSGGTTFGQLTVSVLDGNNAPVPNPVSGNSAFNNVRLEILQPSGQGDAVLAATNAAGQAVEGATISTRTTDGVVTVSVRSGVRSGTYTVRATTDRADNNVDNGITDPVVADRAIAISDGRLFSISITQPVEGLRENLSVDPTVTVTDPDGNLPLSPDGSYSLTVAAIATDRLGNPVIPGTLIKFGLVDYPQEFDGAGFDISGGDGNPQESGTAFTAPSGRFTTAGGGAGPGDALLIFGHEVEGNRDHESARVVTRVNSATSLTVDRRFNANDDTGTSVDSGNVLPYVIGRATRGNIIAQGETNQFGVVRTTMNYPVSQLGLPVAVWAQGEGDIVGGQAETVADVDPLVFSGAAPLTLVVSPDTIPANGTSSVGLCVTDAFGSPIRGVLIGFSFNGLEGTGSVDGNGTSGVIDNRTDGSGCTSASITTSGVLNSSSPSVVFNAGGATATVTLTTATLVLQARPSVITTSSQLVRLTLLNGSGAPQPGFLLIGSCTGDNGTIVALSNGPGITDAQGQTTVQVTATNLDQINGAGGGSCEFSTADGSVSTTVELIGQDLCELQISPPPVGCTPPVTFAVTLTLNDGPSTVGYSVVSTPAGIACAVGDGGSQTCTGSFPQGTEVVFSTMPVGGGPEVNWTGVCVPVDGTNPDDQSIIPSLAAAATCTATSP